MRVDYKLTVLWNIIKRLKQHRRIVTDNKSGNSRKKTQVIETGIQLYFIGKYSSKKRRMFDKKLWVQCVALVAYYVACGAYLSAMIYRSGVGYISVFAIALCPLWLAGGSRILWTGHTGEEDFYLNDMGKWHAVSNIMENDDVVEITCRAPGDRERTISIAKKKQQLDQ